MNEFIIYFMLVSLATQAALQDTICKSTGLLAVDCFDMKRIALFFYGLNALDSKFFDLFNIQFALASYTNDVALFAVNPALF